MTPTLHELADFTGHTILFTDPEHDDFVVLKAGNDFVKNFYGQMVIIGHRCKMFKVAQFLSSEDALQGQCWWCKAKVPESILTIWKLQNFDNLPRIIENVAFIKHWKAKDPANGSS
ncbi:hypothetical protein LCGC14_2039700 [marine sediment metagenome]|uniref:Uncharacterized protein n=1 Tax=marine sediment metagenome TaxID=412755 RepID=A0A0F9ES51_9ZZZZ